MPPPSNNQIDSTILPDRDKNLLLFIGLRPLIISFLIFLSYPILYDIPTPFVIILILSSSLVPIFFLLSRVLTRNKFYLTIFIVDSILITLLILHSGGSESLFPLMYPIVILGSSIYIYRGAFTIATISFLLYSVVIYFELKGGFFPIQYFYARTYLYGLLFFLVAYLSSNLTTKIKKAEITTAEIIGSLPLKIAAIDQDGNLFYSNVSDSKIKEMILKFHNTKQDYSEITLEDRTYSIVSHPLSMNPQLKLILMEDITEQKKMVDRNKSYEKLRLLAQLGASLAHEIRNPLASIRGATELISKAKLSKKQSSLLRLAISEVDRASRTIEDFLEFSRMRPLKLRRLRLKNIIEDLLSAEPIPDNIKIRLDFPEKIAFRADRYLIYRAMRNLIQNAKQAIDDSNGEIVISSRIKDKTVEFSVSDNGYGIPRKNLHKIFEPFFSTREDGTGLGLSIVETIITQHGGTISVTSKIGKGTTFTISLPRRYA